LAGERASRLKGQTAVKLVYDLTPIILTADKRPPPNVSMDVMTAFFTITKEDTDDFRVFIIGNIVDLDLERSSRFFMFVKSVAADISPDLMPKITSERNKLIRQAIDVIENTSNLSTPLVLGAFSMITVFAAGVPPANVQSFVSRALITRKPAHFVLRSVVSLVAAFAKESPQWDDAIRGKIGRLVLECWNAHAAQQRILATACLDLCVTVRPPWAEEKLTRRWERLQNLDETSVVSEADMIDFTARFPYS
jgi:hypothetical protein